MFAEIITIGDELLIGQVVDTNSAWMGQELNKIGIEVLRIVSIRDREEEIMEAIDNAMERVKSVDDSLLYHEFLCYHGDKLFDFTPEIHIDVKDNSKNISETEKEFLRMYEALKIK